MLANKPTGSLLEPLRLLATNLCPSNSLCYPTRLPGPSPLRSNKPARFLPPLAAPAALLPPHRPPGPHPPPLAAPAASLPPQRPPGPRQPSLAAPAT
ncbi:hypothetical protein PCANC_18077 [Puccinia coronata f. sp. avenae]|uniref:Uncharacterized protein n=1 Tax=Puccinia coronata f. sp. avenae TaxID=200324 RepID=A0A2N5SLR3_9BASI|nr:hypothetical protein PCANC_18077 [Puccinia coronata f. sp. avenae]